jgi:hypothetical protein
VDPPSTRRRREAGRRFALGIASILTGALSAFVFDWNNAALVAFKCSARLILAPQPKRALPRDCVPRAALFFAAAPAHE